MGTKHRLTLADTVVAVLFAAAVVCAFVYARDTAGSRRLLVISTQGGEEVYDLRTDSVYAVEGPLGTTTIRVSGGTAYFESSPCPNQTCVQAHALSEAGDWSACLPNQVFIRIEGSASELDAVAE